MVTESKSSLDASALSMMSNTYFFEYKNASHSSLVKVGQARVVGVVINESSAPELLLSVSGCKYIESYSIDELSYSSTLSIAV